MSQYLPVIVEWMGVIAVTMILSLSPAFKRRPLIFKFPRRETIIAMSLLAGVVLVVVVVFLLVPPPPVPPEVPVSVAADPAPLVFSLVDLGNHLTLSLLSMLPFIIVLRVRGQPWLSVGLSRPTLRAGLQLGFALGLITIFLTNKTYSIINGVTAPEGIYLLAMIGAAFSQEFIFRGYIQPRLSSLTGDRLAWVVTAVLYTIWKLPQYLVNRPVDLEWVALDLLFIFLFALILGWIMRKSGNILAPAIYHAIHNWALIL